MSLKESSTKKIAAAACGVGLLLFGAACSSTISGSATYSGEGKQDTSSSKSDDDDPTTSKDDDDTTTSDDGDETTTSDDGGDGSLPTDPNNPPAAAPDESYAYNNGVTISLSAPQTDDSLGGLLSSETGRVVNVTIDNPSSDTIDMSNYRYDTDVTCPAGDPESQYILNKSDPDTGPEQLTGGQSGTYRLEIAIVKEAVGTPCLIELVFMVDGSAPSDIANFTMTF